MPEHNEAQGAMNDYFANHQAGANAESQKKGQDQNYLVLSRNVSDLLGRLRLLEERYTNLRREHQTTGQNMIENHQDLSKKQRRLADNITELKRQLQDLKEQLNTMQAELAEAASANELKVLQRYMDFWEPVNFITREEAEELISQAKEAQTQKLYKQQEEQ